ncbi:MAG: single-stranded DNA-binding protein [Lentisphaeria bacterium]
MANLNKVFLIGNLTRDPELRPLPSGTSLCSFGMAINRMQTLASGEQREEVCYVDVVAMGRQAEVICQYTRKGSPLFVEGRLHFEQWDDRETGKKRSRLSVRVERSQFLGSSQQSSQAPNAGENPSYAPPAMNSGYAPQRGAATPSGMPVNFAVPPAPSYRNVAPAPAAMPAFQPMPEPPVPYTPPQASQSTPSAAVNPHPPSDSEPEVEDDIPF